MMYHEQLAALAQLSQTEMLKEVTLPLLEQEIAAHEALLVDDQREVMGDLDRHLTIEFYKAAKKRIEEM